MSEIEQEKGIKGLLGDGLVVISRQGKIFARTAEESRTIIMDLLKGAYNGNTDGRDQNVRSQN